MNKPTTNELAESLRAHADIIASVQNTGDEVDIEFIPPKVCGSMHLCTKVFLFDHWIQPSTAYIDKRRKKRFHYEDYGDISILTKDLLKYMSTNYEKDYSEHSPIRLRSLVKKWSMCKLLKSVDAHEHGKIVATF